ISIFIFLLYYTIETLTILCSSVSSSKISPVIFSCTATDISFESFFRSTDSNCFIPKFGIVPKVLITESTNFIGKLSLTGCFPL
ncbi:MAG TPA: hypothetical protein DCL31_01000, partial [Clostridium sp.]|nr:hypothetical protein [Clostridium sp.]